MIKGASAKSIGQGQPARSMQGDFAPTLLLVLNFLNVQGRFNFLVEFSIIYI